MFPFDIEDEEIEIENEEAKEEVEPKEYGVDFATGQLTGEIVTGKDAIAVWCWFALHTKRYAHEQYSWDYGIELQDLIGKSYSIEYIESEAGRMIEECLTVNEYVQGIDGLTVTLEKDKLTCTFKIITDYGEVEMNV